MRLAEEGADIIAFDICRSLGTVPYPLATADDLRETVDQIERLDRRIFAREVDVRDGRALTELVRDGSAELGGRLDIVCANAGIAHFAENAWSIDEDIWDDMIAINLTGVWKTAKAAIPAMIEAGNGGSVVFTSSTAGSKGMSYLAHYVAAKHGVVGLAETLANELAAYMIRVNTLLPTGVDTPMIDNDFVRQFLQWVPPDGRNLQNALPVSVVESVDVSNALVWLCSDEARYVTGVALPVDAGFLQR